VTRYWVAATFLLTASGLSGTPTLAQDYPARTITMIVPFAVGGPADITGRIVADIFSRRLGRAVVVENINGAGGTIGALRAARATADGYTLLFGHMSTNALAPAFYPNLGYDPQKDFEPIGLAAEYPELLVVRKDFPPGTSVSLSPMPRPIRTSSTLGTRASARYPISDACFLTPRLASSRPWFRSPAQPRS
jgi:tripartite-type tricarboxylate transporter receptor subunit TctC